MRVRGSQLRFERQKRGLTQQELAVKADLSPEYVGVLERGERQGGIRSLAKLADALGVSIEAIAFIEEPVEEPA